MLTKFDTFILTFWPMSLTTPYNTCMSFFNATICLINITICAELFYNTSSHGDVRVKTNNVFSNFNIWPQPLRYQNDSYAQHLTSSRLTFLQRNITICQPIMKLRPMGLDKPNSYATTDAGTYKHTTVGWTKWTNSIRYTNTQLYKSSFMMLSCTRPSLSARRRYLVKQ